VGWFCTSLSLIHLPAVFVGAPASFAITYTAGNILSMSSMFFPGLLTFSIIGAANL
jgi:hypothetical protein